MKFTVVLTEKTGGIFHATVPGLPDCTIDAPTRHEALNQVRCSIQSLLSHSEILPLDIPTEPKSIELQDRTPWEYFGKFKDQPEGEDVFEQIALDRRESGLGGQ